MAEKNKKLGIPPDSVSGDGTSADKTHISTELFDSLGPRAWRVRRMKQNLLCDVPPAVLPRNRSRAAPDCPPRFAADDIKRRSGSKPWVGAGRLGPPLFAKDRQNLGVALDSMPQTHMREQTSPRAQHGKSKQGTKHVSCPRPPPPPPLEQEQIQVMKCA